MRPLTRRKEASEKLIMSSLEYINILSAETSKCFINIALTSPQAHNFANYRPIITDMAVFLHRQVQCAEVGQQVAREFK